MAIQPMALSVANPQVNALSAFAEGRQAQEQSRANNLALAQQTLQNVGSLAFGVMGGKLDGQPDPKLWDQALNMISQQGVDVSQFRGRPDLAPVIARASVDTLGQLQLAQNDRELEQRMKEFDFRVQEAMRGPAPTAEMRNYEWAAGDPNKQAYLGMGAQAGARPLSPEERQQWGIPETDTRPYSITPGKPPEPVGGSGGQTINVNTAEGVDSQLNGALSKAEGESWAGFKDAAAVSASNAQDFQVLGELLTLAPQGPITGRLADTFKGFNSAADASNSIIKRIAPTLRAPGSGATSDIEYNGMLQSLPSLAQNPEANAMVLSIMQAKAQINMARGRIVSAYQNGEMTIGEARKAMDALNAQSIMTPDMKKALLGLGSDGQVGQAPPSVGEIVDGYRYEGGDPASPTSWTQVQ